MEKISEGSLENQIEEKFYLISLTGVKIPVTRPFIEKWDMLNAFFLSDRWTVGDGFQTSRTTEELASFVSKYTNIISIEDEFRGGPEMPEIPEVKIPVESSPINVIDMGCFYYSIVMREKKITITITKIKNVNCYGYIIYVSEKLWNSIKCANIRDLVIIPLLRKSKSFEQYLSGNGPAIGDHNLRH